MSLCPVPPLPCHCAFSLFLAKEEVACLSKTSSNIVAVRSFFLLFIVWLWCLLYLLWLSIVAVLVVLAVLAMLAVLAVLDFLLLACLLVR